MTAAISPSAASTGTAAGAPALRPARAEDAAECGRIIYEAFKSIHDRHDFRRDFASVEAATQLAEMFINHPSFYGVAAEVDGRVVGSNFLDERSDVRGVGPITVDPGLQQKGVGRLLMRDVIERGRGARGIRLVQDSFNMLSLSLYASLGFDVTEPLALVEGSPKAAPRAGAEVRPMREEDLAGCAALCERVHGFSRAGELRDALRHFKPYVLVRGGRVAAYASAPTFWPLNHGVAETEDDMRALLAGAAARCEEPLRMLVPTRQASLFRWCLGEGLRVVKPMTLMTMGEYQKPSGCWFPSVLF
ncbi:MAG: GNAT family N-acetyltransferase [Acidobacteriota bacterium]|nr:GNAT family N-acetyltransferase [Acidobacteriota bacterium]